MVLWELILFGCGLGFEGNLRADSQARFLSDVENWLDPVVQVSNLCVKQPHKLETCATEALRAGFMSANNSNDEIAYYDQELSRLGEELAAAVRQYQRATDANDAVAMAVETEALTVRIQRLLYNHLGLQIGMTSEDWFWLNGPDDCKIVPLSAQTLRITGRIHCSLTDGFRRWKEPFEAKIVHSSSAQECDYEIWLGRRETLLNLPRVRELIELGEEFAPTAPVEQDGWAFVFSNGEFTEE